MGSVELNNLTWDLFWIGVAFLLSIGGLFSYGILRIFQKKKGQGIISLVLSFVVLAYFINFASNL